MNNDMLAIVKAITELDGPYDRDLEKSLQNFLAPLKAAAKEGADLSTIVDFLRRGVETKIAAKRVLLLSALGDITGEEVWFERLLQEARSLPLSLADRHALFVQITISLFVNNRNSTQIQTGLRSLFHQLVQEMDSELGGTSLASGRPEPVKDRVVILTPQFLSIQHPTTLRVAEYVNSLVEDFGKTPIIVESHPFPAAPGLAFVPSIVMNRNAELKAVDRVNISGRDIEYYRVASEAFSLSDVAHTLSLVSALAPELVIAISSPYLAAEAVALRFPTFSQPTTAAAPITCRAQSFSWSPLSPEERSILERFGTADRCRFHMHPGFSIPEARPAVSREDLALPGDGFVFAVIGNRLDNEVDARFLDLLETIVAHPRAHIAMMGKFNDFDRVMAQRPKLKGRVSFLGYRDDILSVLRVCDACLNPDRTGGGRSGAYALHVGLPVLSLPRGDVASIVGPQDCCADYAEMSAQAVRLIDDADWREQRRAAAFARAETVIGVKALISRIFEETGIR
jgi:glycosyltransferase involved in cell wall biosynthesis